MTSAMEGGIGTRKNRQSIKGCVKSVKSADKVEGVRKLADIIYIEAP